jgi:hypothetical protein
MRAKDGRGLPDGGWEKEVEWHWRFCLSDGGVVRIPKTVKADQGTAANGGGGVPLILSRITGRYKPDYGVQGSNTFKVQRRPLICWQL